MQTAIYLGALALASMTAMSAVAQTVHRPNRAVGKLDAGIFESAPAECAASIFAEAPSGDVLRTLTVSERVGAARQAELVRVPLFFHAGECADPDALSITAADDPAAPPIAYQADDIRRDASGQVARLHVYFLIDLKPWERKRFTVRRGKNPAAEPMPITQTADRVTLGGELLKLAFLTAGEKAGAIAAIETPLGKIDLPLGAIGPEVSLVRQNEKCEPLRRTTVSYDQPKTLEVRDLRWASGPLFSKLVLLIGPKGVPDNAEYTFVLPKSASEFVLTQRLFCEEPNVNETVGAGENKLITGRMFLGADGGDQRQINVPAGLRLRTRSFFDHVNTAIVSRQAGMSVFMIPNSQGGTSGATVQGDMVNFYGPRSFNRRPDSNSATLRVFWTQARFIVSRNTEPEDLWKLSVKSFQPLTAVVDEPWAKPGDLSNITAAWAPRFYDIKNWKRTPDADAVLAYLSHDQTKLDAALKSFNATAPLPVGAFVPSREAIDKAWKNWNGAPPLDPYTITYGSTGLTFISALVQPTAGADFNQAALAQASRLVNGRVNPVGSPYVKSFGNAANMHQGTYLAGLWGGGKTGEADLVQWSRDATQNQALLANYGHAQRPYSLDVGGSDVSDQLYMSVVDLWLRGMELINNEDLSLHPSVYGRYTDCIDVNADLYQHRFLPDGNRVNGYTRAMMMGGQSHDHRWEEFACDPYLAMVEDASAAGGAGITEACYFMTHRTLRTPTWNLAVVEMMVPEVLLSKGLANYHPAPRPPLPAEVQARAENGQMVVTWKPVDGASGYRIYRATTIGGPYLWLNSPYTKASRFVPPTAAERAAGQASDIVAPALPNTLITEPRYVDPDGDPHAYYFVTAVDASRRESRWFPDEPLPKSSK